MTVPSLCRSRFCGPPVISRSSSSGLFSDPPRVGFLGVARSDVDFGFEVEGRDMAGRPLDFAVPSSEREDVVLSPFADGSDFAWVLDPMGMVLPFSLKRVEPVLPLTSASRVAVVVSRLVDAKGNPFLDVVEPARAAEEEEKARFCLRSSLTRWIAFASASRSATPLATEKVKGSGRPRRKRGRQQEKGRVLTDCRHVTDIIRVGSSAVPPRRGGGRLAQLDSV